MNRHPDLVARVGLLYCRGPRSFSLHSLFLHPSGEQKQARVPGGGGKQNEAESEDEDEVAILEGTYRGLTTFSTTATLCGRRPNPPNDKNAVHAPPCGSYYFPCFGARTAVKVITTTPSLPYHQTSP